MARIPEETLQAIRDRVDLVDLIGRHVHLKKAGRNFVGLCPFHSEKTPSFNVNVERQIYHCFGCGEGGNAITFLMQHENLTFPEAARTLARELGIEVPEHEAPGEAGLTERLRAANELAQDLYAEALARPQAEAAREYLARRGNSPFPKGTLEPSRCPLLGMSPKTIQVEGQVIGHWFLQVDTQPEVGPEAYDKGAEILYNFFKEQISKYTHDDLHPTGKRIIGACMDGATVEDYAAFTTRS